MSPRLGPRPAHERYQIIVTELDTEDPFTYTLTGDAYVVGVATGTVTGMIADVDHDGPQALREHLLGFIVKTVLDS